jgi:RNA polymerase sigma factor (sigma-70 family)
MSIQTVEEKWEQFDLDKLKANDPDELSELFNLLLPRVRLIARSALRARKLPPNEADDIAQEVILSLFSSLHKYQPATSAALTSSEITKQPEYEMFRSWCLTVIYNLVRTKANNCFRQSKKEINEADNPSPLLDVNSAYESALLLGELLNKLNPKERALLLMWSQPEFTYREIAELLGISAAAARYQTSRMIGKLKKEMEESSLRGGTLNVPTEKKETAF